MTMLSEIEEDVLPKVRESSLPDFEGQPVHEIKVKLAAANDLDMGREEALKIDQSLRLVVTARVSRVDHVVDEKTGNLVRQHTLKITDCIPADWNDVADLVLGEV